jgi:hypothetical protein
LIAGWYSRTTRATSSRCDIRARSSFVTISAIRGSIEGNQSRPRTLQSCHRNAVDHETSEFHCATRWGDPLEFGLMRRSGCRAQNDSGSFCDQVFDAVMSIGKRSAECSFEALEFAAVHCNGAEVADVVGSMNSSRLPMKPSFEKSIRR